MMANSKSILTIPEVADLLRVPVGRAYEMARTKILPTIRLGRQLRVDREQLSQFLQKGGKGLPGGWRKQPRNAAEDQLPPAA